jgi:hypothetical protein
VSGIFISLAFLVGGFGSVLIAGGVAGFWVLKKWGFGGIRGGLLMGMGNVLVCLLVMGRGCCAGMVLLVCEFRTEYASAVTASSLTSLYPSNPCFPNAI